MTVSSQPRRAKERTKEKGFSFSAVVVFVALLVTAAGAASGQYLLDEDIVMEFFHSRALVPVDPALWGVLPGASLLVVSGVLFALACRRRIATLGSEDERGLPAKASASWPSSPDVEALAGDARLAERDGPSDALPPRAGWATHAWLAAQFVSAAVGLGLAGHLARNLLAGKYSSELPLVALGCILAFFLSLLCKDVRRCLAESGALARSVGVNGSEEPSAYPLPSRSERETIAPPSERTGGQSSPLVELERKSLEAPGAGNGRPSPLGPERAGESAASSATGDRNQAPLSLVVAEKGMAVFPTTASAKWFPLRSGRERGLPVPSSAGQQLASPPLPEQVGEDGAPFTAEDGRQTFIPPEPKGESLAPATAGDGRKFPVPSVRDGDALIPPTAGDGRRSPLPPVRDIDAPVPPTKGDGRGSHPSPDRHGDAPTPPTVGDGRGSPLPPQWERARVRAPSSLSFNLFKTVRSGLRIDRLAETAYLFLLIALFVYLNSRDLTDTAYAALGDEYSFFNVAKFIAMGGPTNLFSQKGVYGYHPVVDSAYQAVVMGHFGINQFGWKLSGVLVVGLSLIPLYFLASNLFGRLTAILASAIAASSHYLFAYAHSGYNNIHSVLPVALSAAAAAVGISRRSSALLFLAGAFAGFGFYTFFSARFAIGALLLAVLVSGKGLATIRLLLCAAAGFAVAVFPLFAVNKMDVIDAMLANSVAKDSASWLAVADEVGKRALQGLLGFNYNPAAVHYVSGSLLEPISAALAALGLVVAVCRLADWRFRFLLVWLILGLIVASGFYQGFNIAMSRLMVLMPFMATFAAVAASGFISTLAGPTGNRASRLAIPVVLVGALGAAILFINLQRFYSITPSRLPARPETLAVEAVLSAEVDHSSYASAVVIAPAPDALARLVFDSYDVGPRNPIFLSAGDKAASERYADSPAIVFIESSGADEQAIFSRLKAAAPDASLTEKWDRSHKTRIGILQNPRPVPSTRLLRGGLPAGLRAVMRLGGRGKSEGRLDGPRGVSTDRKGNLYVADTGNYRVQKFDAGGNLLGVFGGSAGSEGYLRSPVSVAVDSSGGMAVLDAGDVGIKRFSADGVYLGRLGSDLKLARPREIVFDSSGSLYVADADRVLKLSPEGRIVATLTGGDGRPPFREPSGLTVDANGRLYVLDGATGAVTKLDSQGRVEGRWDTPARGGDGQPKIGVSPDGSLLVSAPNSRAILKLSSSGQTQGFFFGKAIVGQQLEVLAGLAMDAKGYVYVVDAGRHELTRLAFY